jgi:O-antigen/teichoic acid export membrane protein
MQSERAYAMGSGHPPRANRETAVTEVGNVQRIAKNSAALVVSNVTSQILNFLYIINVARYFGAAGFGILSFALALATIFGTLIDFGLGSLTVREVARNKAMARKYLGNLTALKVILALLTIVVVTLVVNLLAYPELIKIVVYIITLSTVLNSFSGIFYSIFQAHERMQYQSAGQILNSGLLFSGALLAIHYGLDLVTFSSIYFLVALSVLGYNSVICTLRFVRPKLEMDLKFCESTIKLALPFGLSLIFSTSYNWVDQVILSYMKGNDVVGWYNAAYGLAGTLLFIPTVVGTAIFPVMSKSYMVSKNSHRFAFERYLRYMAFIGFPLGTGMTLLAGRIVLLVFGAQYLNSIVALQLLVWSPICVFLSSGVGYLLQSANRQGIVAVITGSCLLLNIALNLWMISMFGYVGAGITNVTTQLVVLVLGLVASSKIGFGLSRGTSVAVVKAATASFLMSILVLYLEYLNWPLPILVLVPAAFYSLVLYLLHSFEEEDVKILRDIKRRSQKQ